MLKNQRHDEILKILKDEHFASVRSLGDKVHASQPTIRRDLDFLEKQGFVHRSHGGVMLADGRTNVPVPFRKATRLKEKSNICRLASRLIESGQTLFIDASTTAFCLSDYLKNDDDLTVITNGISLCRTLSENKLRVFSTGGRLVRESEAFVGRLAEDAATNFYADLMFFSSSALDDGGVISDYSEEETNLRRVMKGSSRKTVFLCDSGKFNTRSAFKVFELGDVDYFVTNETISEDIVQKFGLKIHLRGDGAVMYKRS